MSQQEHFLIFKKVQVTALQFLTANL